MACLVLFLSIQGASSPKRSDVASVAINGQVALAPILFTPDHLLPKIFAPEMVPLIQAIRPTIEEELKQRGLLNKDRVIKSGFTDVSLAFAYLGNEGAHVVFESRDPKNKFFVNVSYKNGKPHISTEGLKK